VLALLIILLRIWQLNKKEKKEEEKKESIEKSIKLEGKASTPEESLMMLNHISKKFFKEYLNEKKEMTYIEMAEKLKNKKYKKMSEFCENMDYFLYSGTKVTKEDALKMINDFSAIVNKIKR
jgi:hypothetical protein